MGQRQEENTASNHQKRTVMCSAVTHLQQACGRSPAISSRQNITYCSPGRASRAPAHSNHTHSLPFTVKISMQMICQWRREAAMGRICGKMPGFRTSSPWDSSRTHCAHTWDATLVTACDRDRGLKPLSNSAKGQREHRDHSPV